MRGCTVIRSIEWHHAKSIILVGRAREINWRHMDCTKKQKYSWRSRTTTQWYIHTHAHTQPQPSDIHTYAHMHIHTTHNVIHVHARLADLVHTSIVDTASLQWAVMSQSYKNYRWIYTLLNLKGCSRCSYWLRAQQPRQWWSANVKKLCWNCHKKPNSPNVQAKYVATWIDYCWAALNLHCWVTHFKSYLQQILWSDWLNWSIDPS